MSTARSLLLPVTALLVSASVSTNLACNGASAPEAPGHNVLVVTLDTTRADRIGAYGLVPRSPSPNLDRMAAQGARFDKAYTVTPLTIPSHSSLFTGMFPPRHGVRDNGDFFLGEGATTLAELFKEKGYATMAAVGAEVTSHHWGFAQGFDAFYDDMSEGKADKNRWRVERTGDLVINDAMGWLEQHAGGEQPFFAWVHLFDAHHPYEPPAPYDQQFKGKPYLGEIAFADAQWARILTLLEERQVLEDTWIVVVADHGEGLGSHGETLHGVLLYNATTKIPMVIRPPDGLEGGRVLDFPVSLVDVLPTLVASEGLRMPEGVDGMDLSPWLGATPAEAPADRAVYVESLYAWHHYGWAPQKALVDPTHYLIDSTTPELYAAGDAAQESDLAATEGSRMQGMRDRLGVLVDGMEPDGATADRAELSAERMAQLEALGYVTSGTADGAEPTDGLPDPVGRLPVLRKVELARKALQDKDPDKALELVEAVIQEEPGLMEPRMLKANVLARRGRTSEGIDEVLEIIALRPESSQPKATLGTMYLQAGRPEDALNQLNQALDIDPYLSHAWAAKLHALFILGNIQALEVEAGRARQMVGSAESIGMEGLVMVLKGQTAQGRAQLERALDQQPQQPFLRFGLGVAFKLEGEADRAEQSLLDEIKLFPPAVPARRTLVEMFASQDRYEEQLEQLEVIMKRSVPGTLDYHSQAQALYNLKRYAEAKKAVDLCVELDLEYAACAMLNANVLNRLGKKDEAKVEYQRALKLAGQEVKPQPVDGDNSDAVPAQ